MSLEKMISLHPDVSGAVNEDLVKAARHAMLCSLFCTSCADACVAEKMDMRQCIRVCLDCARCVRSLFTADGSSHRTGHRDAADSDRSVLAKLCFLTHKH